MEEKKNKYIWIIVILLIIILTLVGFICYDKFFNVSTQDNNVIENKDSNNVVDNEKKEESIVIKEVLYDTSSYGNDSIEIVELTTTGEVLVTITGNAENTYDRKEIIKNVKTTSLVHVGQSDICEGNAKLMFILEDGTVSYLDIDALVCDSTINLQSIPSLKNIVEITEKEEESKNEYEPSLYTVYAKDNTGTLTDITEYFE